MCDNIKHECEGYEEWIELNWFVKYYLYKNVQYIFWEFIEILGRIICCAAVRTGNKLWEIHSPIASLHLANLKFKLKVEYCRYLNLEIKRIQSFIYKQDKNDVTIWWETTLVTISFLIGESCMNVRGNGLASIWKKLLA